MAVRGGDHVVVESKTGQRFDGALSSATDSGVTVSVHSNAVTIDRADVRRVYAVSAGLGAAAGGCGKSGFGPCFDKSATIPIGAAVGAVAGALTGLVIGSLHHKRILIYEAK